MNAALDEGAVEVDVVRVFTTESGEHGNELGIVRNSLATAGREQAIAGPGETHELKGRSIPDLVEGLDPALHPLDARVCAFRGSEVLHVLEVGRH